jgi:hypothetical protein
MRIVEKRFLFVFACTLLVAMFTACGAAEQRGAKPSADWSRGAPLGGGSMGSVGLAVRDEDASVRLVWPVGAGEGERIHYLHLERSGDPIVTKDLAFPGQLRNTRLLPAGGDKMHLFWANRISIETGWQLWHVLLNSDGDLVGEPTRVSSDKSKVGDYSAASDNTGGAVVAWGSGSQADLHMLHMNQGGEVLSGPVILTTRGESPDLRVDPGGYIQLVWLSGTSFMYAEMPLDDLRSDNGVPVAGITIGTGDSLTGPVLGLSDGWVYVFWSILSQSGLEAGTARTEFAAFPSGMPASSESKPVWILPVEEQPYVPYQGSLSLTGYIEPPKAAIASTDYIMRPAPMTGINPELAVAVSAEQQLRMNAQLQNVVLLFKDGQYTGYSLASKTGQISDYPVLSVDKSGNLYLVWQEGARKQDVFYATTEPGAVTALDGLSTGDFVNAVLEGGMESLVSLAFMPFLGFGWLLPGLIVIGIWKLIKDEESVSQPSSWPVLIIAIILYYSIKMMTLPTIATYVPFSAWIYIPADWELALRIGVPLTIFAISLFVALKVSVKYSDSAVLFYVVLALTDALLTLAIYGVNFLGVF